MAVFPVMQEASMPALRSSRKLLVPWYTNHLFFRCRIIGRCCSSAKFPVMQEASTPALRSPIHLLCSKSRVRVLSSTATCSCNTSLWYCRSMFSLFYRHSTSVLWTAISKFFVSRICRLIAAGRLVDLTVSSKRLLRLPPACCLSE